MPTQITKIEMLQLYEQGLGEDFINTGDRIYCRTTKQQAGKPEKYIVVYCNV